MRVLATVVIVLVVIAAAALGVVYGGFVNVAADEPHTGLTHGLLATARDRSIAARAQGISAPPLQDPAMVRRGAGNYDAMCVQCHLAPGLDGTELSRGLYPTPPNLAKPIENRSPEQLFWIIKHGIKATGMPAWGKSMEDNYIWDLVALTRKLPEMTAEQYRAEVTASGGHSHGGTEQMGEHPHGGNAKEGEHPHSHSHSETPAESEPSKPHVHTHPDGKSHVHK